MGINFNYLRKQSVDNRERLINKKTEQYIKMLNEEIYKEIKEGNTSYSIRVENLKNIINNEDIFEDVFSRVILYYEQQGANAYVDKKEFIPGFISNNLVIDWSNT